MVAVGLCRAAANAEDLIGRKMAIATPFRPLSLPLISLAVKGMRTVGSKACQIWSQSDRQGRLPLSAGRPFCEPRMAAFLGLCVGSRLSRVSHSRSLGSPRNAVGRSAAVRFCNTLSW